MTKIVTNQLGYTYDQDNTECESWFDQPYKKCALLWSHVANEPGGTSYRHRMENPKFTFAGKTGSSQIKRFTEAQREAEVKQADLNYKDRDHALFVAFAPYNDPKYAISVVVEHGGSGGSAAAPIAKKIIKKVLERHDLRQDSSKVQGEAI